jgi:hypothetical protein
MPKNYQITIRPFANIDVHNRAVGKEKVSYLIVFNDFLLAYGLFIILYATINET